MESSAEINEFPKVGGTILIEGVNADGLVGIVYENDSEIYCNLEIAAQVTKNMPEAPYDVHWLSRTAAFQETNNPRTERIHQYTKEVVKRILFASGFLKDQLKRIRKLPIAGRDQWIIVDVASGPLPSNYAKRRQLLQILAHARLVESGVVKVIDKNADVHAVLGIPNLKEHLESKRIVEKLAKIRYRSHMRDSLSHPGQAINPHIIISGARIAGSYSAYLL